MAMLHRAPTDSLNFADFPEHDEQPGPSTVGKLLQTVAQPFQTLRFRNQLANEFLKAIKSGHSNTVLQILAHHPKLLSHQAYLRDGDTVWHLLAEYGDCQTLQMLINFVQIHWGIHQKSPATNRRKAAQVVVPPHLHEGVVKLINLGNKLCQTPLMFAAYHGRDDVIQLLLKHGADPWLADRCGQRTALHYACMKGHPQCVRSLLDNITPAQQQHEGVRHIDVRTSSGYTPLHFAIASNSVACVVALLAWDPRLDAINVFEAGEFWVGCTKKSTPLHVAAYTGYEDCAQALLQYYEDNKERLHLQDPRLWLDARNDTPQRVAWYRGFYDLEAKLNPKAEIWQLWSTADTAAFSKYGAVPMLKVLAAQVLRTQLQESITEAEECMKMLGTYQNHGRLFARVAYGYANTSKAGVAIDESDNSYNMYAALNFSAYGGLPTPSLHGGSVLGNSVHGDINGSIHRDINGSMHSGISPAAMASASMTTPRAGATGSMGGMMYQQGMGGSMHRGTAYAQLQLSQQQRPTSTSGAVNGNSPPRSMVDGPIYRPPSTPPMTSSTSVALSHVGCGGSAHNIKCTPTNKPSAFSSSMLAPDGGDRPEGSSGEFSGDQRSSSQVLMPGSVMKAGSDVGSMRRGAGVAVALGSAEESKTKATIKQWLSYSRYMNSVAQRNAQRRLAGITAQDRSKLSYAAITGGAIGWYQGVLEWLGVARRVIIPPQLGEDVCGLCHDNKPHIQMPCSHRVCLVCAKKLCHALDLQRVVLCPYCTRPITEFQLA